ncbi:PREDICTED: uncharacterized protein LOC109150185 [Ipomoea nil]|uniref:uncharacterized protein LOC109150185 n=1 Tax=Ipomoea nil TaxID=35883 RepID=UPI00090113BE|nr:PREDICTED: uncharacterized protein LOC109150185 [Ipomoea nil]XP_019153638.1 PREDICTED: uncharacterized protein LOC109150185 [Ipomoea nil]
MVVKGGISEYRDRLDKTLLSQDLVNEDLLKGLVKSQIISSLNIENEECIDNVVERRTKEVQNVLGMLRSTSVTDGEKSKSSEPSHGWKIKQDSEEFRVMYREGPEGTPFHTLLVEGYVDGPVDVCHCISWEADLYKKWLPQSTIPTFKISFTQCLQKIRIGEQISLVRMKLSWPLSSREALLHYFEFDYFQDGLVIVLLNSISDVEGVDISTHGFSKDGIPDAQDVVRIDVVGGFAMQKVTANRSYFRTIANLDIKLDLVPPAFINFISRQLIGSGFKLYKKEVASVTRGDEDFSKALKDPLYSRVREALYSDHTCNGAPVLENLTGNSDKQAKDESRDENVNMDHIVINSPAGGNENVSCEIEEIDEEDGEKSENLPKDDREQCDSPSNPVLHKCFNSKSNEVVISRDVQQALATLEKAIAFIRENQLDLDARPSCGANAKKPLGTVDKHDVEEVKFSAELPGKESTETTSSYEHSNSYSSRGSRRISSSLCTRETNHNKIAPASPDVYIANPSETRDVVSHSPEDQREEETILEKTLKSDHLSNITSENRIGRKKPRKLKNRCFSFLPGRGIA